MDFTPVTQAINALEDADKQYEGLSQADAAAQEALVSADATAKKTADAKANGKVNLIAAADAVKKAIDVFESDLNQ